MKTFTNPDGTVTYGYDTAGQVTSATYTGGGTNETYTYDKSGNRTIAGYSTTSDNRLSSDGTYNYTYDAEGNRTRRTKISDSTYIDYTYDYHNRLTDEVYRTSGGVKTKALQYVYDVNDRRIERRLDAAGDGVYESKERYIYDGEDIVLVYDGSNVLVNRYLHGPDFDQPLAEESAGSVVKWYLSDEQGSIRDMGDNAGNLVAGSHVIYNSFGVVTSGTPGRYAYTGREWDSDAGMYYYRARWYDQSIGRFISQDPKGFDAEDANLYRYVGNNSVNLQDPSGLNAVDRDESYWSYVVGGTSGGAVGTIASVKSIEPLTVRQWVEANPGLFSGKEINQVGWAYNATDLAGTPPKSYTGSAVGALSNRLKPGHAQYTLMSRPTSEITAYPISGSPDLDAADTLLRALRHTTSSQEQPLMARQVDLARAGQIELLNKIPALTEENLELYQMETLSSRGSGITIKSSGESMGVARGRMLQNDLGAGFATGRVITSYGVNAINVLGAVDLGVNLYLQSKDGGAMRIPDPSGLSDADREKLRESLRLNNKNPPPTFNVPIITEGPMTFSDSGGDYTVQWPFPWGLAKKTYVSGDLKGHTIHMTPQEYSRVKQEDKQYKESFQKELEYQQLTGRRHNST